MVYDLATCAVGGVDVCQVNGSGHLVCDVSAAPSASKVVVVTDFTATSDYEAWGSYGGTDFCCPIAGAGVYEVHILGSTYADELRFSDNLLTWNLSNPGFEQSLVAIIHGDQGNDQIEGSDTNSADYSEFLYGEQQSDVMQGNGGEDYMEGNDNDDTMFGGADADEMYGNAGYDFMFGAGGDDVMYGGAQGDRMGGGDGDDYLNGGADGDIICGDGESSGDTLLDGDTVNESPNPTDQLWASVSVDDVTCGNSSTKFDGNASVTSGTCHTTHLTTKPALCP